MTDDVLLVVAAEQEAEHLPTDARVLLTGVGKVQAAIAVTAALAREETRPRLVVNLGTAGALQPGLAGTHEIGVVHQHDLDSVLLERLTGRRHGSPIVLGPGLRLATGDVFVQDPTVRDAVARDADLVDMEGYAVAAACRAAGVPVRLVKHVSDAADGAAARRWVDTVDEAGRALAAWVAAELANR
jgi:adenosylhomocysteine nucleosidase